MTALRLAALRLAALRLAALRLAAAATGGGSDWRRQRLAAAATGCSSDYSADRDSDWLSDWRRQRLHSDYPATGCAVSIVTGYAVTACARVGAHVYTHVTPQASMASWSISNVPSSQNWKFIVLILFMIVETALVCWGTAFKVCYCPTFRSFTSNTFLVRCAGCCTRCTESGRM